MRLCRGLCSSLKRCTKLLSVPRHSYLRGYAHIELHYGNYFWPHAGPWIFCDLRDAAQLFPRSPRRWRFNGPLRRIILSHDILPLNASLSGLSAHVFLSWCSPS